MNESVSVYSDLSSPQSRATRCLSLRDMMGLSREAVRLRYGIARGTLQNWESARFGGLTQKGAKIIITASRAEGIEVSMPWLLHGIGIEPRLTGAADVDFSHKGSFIASEQEMQNLSKMLNTFRAHNPDFIDLVVQDDLMCPFYSAGEHVAGNRRYLSDIETVVGSVCIVQTPEHGHLLRYLKLGDEINLYHLVSINHESQVSQATLYNSQIVSAAPVIWRYKFSGA